MKWIMGRLVQEGGESPVRAYLNDDAVNYN